MRIGVVFGCGSSIDALPDKFFRWAEKQAFTIGMNSSPLCTRMAEANFMPTHYCAWDPYEPNIPHCVAYTEALKGWVAKGVTPYLGGEWPIPSAKPSRKPVKFTAEWAVHIAAADHKCDEIILVGAEGRGPHHRMLDGWTHDLWISGPPKLKVTGLRQLYKLAIKWAVQCATAVNARVWTWPYTSILYPKPITNLFMVDKLFDNDAGWCNGSMSDLSSEALGSTPGPATKIQESTLGAALCSQEPSDTATQRTINPEAA